MRNKNVKSMKKWKNKSAEPLWVTKDVTKKEWSVMKNIEDYCHLENIGSSKFGKVRVGFLVAGRPYNNIPKDCSICTDSELRIIDLYRRSKNLYPYPLIDVLDEIPKNPVKPSIKKSAEIPFAF